jgi:hypothetical protein
VAAIGMLTWALLSAGTEGEAAATRYVSPGGDDRHLGTEGSPWRTLRHAGAALRPGDTLILLPGTYAGEENQLVPTSGAAGRYTTIRAQAPFTAVLESACPGPASWEPMIKLRSVRYVAIEGLRLQAGCLGGAVAIGSADHIKLLGLLVKNGVPASARWGSAVVVGHGSDHVLLEDVAVVGAMRYGVLVSGAPSAPTRKVILRRVVVRPDFIQSREPKAGIAFYGDTTGGKFGPMPLEDALCQNCMVLDFNPGFTSPVAGAITAPHDTRRIRILGSLVVRTPYNGIFLAEDPRSEGNTVEETLITGTARNAGAAVAVRHGVGAMAIRRTTVHGMGRGVSAFGTAGVRLSSSLLLDSAAPNRCAAACEERFNLYYPPAARSASATEALLADPANPYPVQIERGSPAFRSGEGGGHRGASILKRYGAPGALWGEPGFDQLGPEPLWPWPFQEEIRALLREPNDPPAGASPATNDVRRGCAADRSAITGLPLSLTDCIWELAGHPSPVPLLRGVAPSRLGGSTRNTITIKGRRFAHPGGGTPEIHVGPGMAEAVQLVDDETVKAILPPLPPGRYDLTLSNAFGAPALPGAIVFSQIAE